MNPKHGDHSSTAQRTAIVTGGASGIGRAFCEELARRGVRVVVADRQGDLAETVARGIRAAGGVATVAELDVRDVAQFKRVVGELVADAGRLDYLFNNAGIAVNAEIKDHEPADWDDVFDVNIRGVAYGIVAAYPVMIRQGFGHIVNTASMAGLVGGSHLGAYTAAKHAVVGLSKALRLEAKPYGVRVSVVCPGLIRTPIMEGGRFGRIKIKADPERMRAQFDRLRPMAPETLARRVLDAVERNRAIIIAPRWWKLFWYLERLSPALSERFGHMVYRRAQRMIEAARVD
jgi:NAD(P)-dependent dehydrogenase (short-subunit alcohol dehydrogenase family)